MSPGVRTPKREGGPRDDERVLQALQHFDHIAPLWVEPADGFHAWARQRRLLVRRQGPCAWRVAWFNADGFTMREGIVTPEYLRLLGMRSIWVYADALSDMLDIIRPLPKGEPNDQRDAPEPEPG